MNMERLMTVREVAEILQIKESTLRQMIQYKKIPYVKLNGKKGAVRFRASDIERWIEHKIITNISADHQE